MPSLAQGVPLRLELGPNDLAKGQATAVRRDTGVKTAIPLDDLATGVHNLLNTIQADLFAAAKKEYDERLKVVTDWKDFVPSLNAKNICVAPWCEVEACEDDIKDQSAEECVLFGLAWAY
jgi:prolyl-tRNA synthetase